MANSTNSLTQMRLDKWLWAARFFKTRSLSSEAIKGGRVHLNGQRVKPSKKIIIQDTLSITRDLETFIIEVIGLNNKRRPAKEAQLLYKESTEHQKKREADNALRKLEKSGFYSKGKPDKKQRRQLKHFKEQ